MRIIYLPLLFILISGQNFALESSLPPKISQDFSKESFEQLTFQHPAGSLLRRIKDRLDNDLERTQKLANLKEFSNSRSSLKFGVKDDDTNTYFKIDNQSPYTLLFIQDLSYPYPSGMIKDMPLAIAPYSSVEFTVGSEDICSGCNSDLLYGYWVGDIGEVGDINEALQTPRPDYLDTVKLQGFLELFFSSDGQSTLFGIYEDANDYAITNGLWLFRDSTYIYQSGDERPWDWQIGTGSDIIEGNPVRINLTITSYNSNPNDFAQVLQPWDLYGIWTQADPDGNGQFMQYLVNCVFFDNLSELFYPSPVMDDFDAGYNSVGWTISRTQNGNIFDPLTDYQNAIAFYDEYGYVETPCDEDDSSELRPSLALYCLTTGNLSQNGGCQLQTQNYTHATIKLPFRDPDSGILSERWTSKFGEGPLLTHSSLWTIGANCGYGYPALCFRKTYDFTVHIDNESPYHLSVVNATNISGLWSLLPNNLDPFDGVSTYKIVSASESYGGVYYRLDLGDTSRPNHTKTMGYFAFTARVAQDWSIENAVSLATYFNDTVIPRSIQEIQFLDVHFYGQASNNPPLLDTLPIEGYPCDISVVSKWSTVTAGPLLSNWQVAEPTPRGAILEGIRDCLYVDQETFNQAKFIDEFDENYNAFGWTVGNLKYNSYSPALDYENALRFYSDYNYEVTNCSSPDADIALYCLLSGEPEVNGGCILNYNVIFGSYNYTHAALRLPSGEWSSKFWSGPLLTHPDPYSISNTGECSQLPTSIGSPIFCFKGTGFFQNNFPNNYPVITNSQIPNLTPPMNIDYSSYVVIENESPYVPVRSYQKRVEYLCVNVYGYESYNEICVSELPDILTFRGLENKEGSWIIKPAEWIPPITGIDKYTLFAQSGNSEGRVTYSVMFGDIDTYIMNSNTRNLSKVKQMDTITFVFECKESENLVEINNVILNPSTTLAFVLGSSTNYNKQLPLTEINWEGQAGLAGPWQEGEIYKYDHPIQIHTELKWLQSTKVTTAPDVFLSCIKSMQKKSGENGTRFCLDILIQPIVIAYQGTYNPILPCLDLQDCALDCTLQKNFKLCSSRVLDDADFNYNCASWSSGMTNGKAFYWPLINETTAISWYTSLGYTTTACFVETYMAPDVTLAMYCLQNPTTNNCMPSDLGNGTFLDYTHIALKLPTGEWSSKHGDRALLTHSSPFDIVGKTPNDGYGAIKLCFKGQSWLQKTSPPGRGSSPFRMENSKNTRQRAFNSVEHYNLDNLVSPRSIREDIEYVKKAVSLVPESISQEFAILYEDWRWKYVSTHPNNVWNARVSIPERFKQMEESRDRLVNFVKKNPESMALFVEKMLSPENHLDWPYLLYEKITGEFCEHLNDHCKASYECARKWVLSSLKKTLYN